MRSVLLFLSIILPQCAPAAQPSCPQGYAVEPTAASCKWLSTECPIANGKGMTIEGDVCVMKSCNTSFHASGQACVSDRSSCTIANGTGEMTWPSPQCVALSCVNGYHLSQNACSKDAVVKGVKTQAELVAALLKAKGGETITLADASFGFLELSNKYASKVIVKGPGRFDGIWFLDAQNITLDGVKVTGTGKPHGKDAKTGIQLVRISGGKGVTVQNSAVTAAVGRWRGIAVSSSDSPSVLNTQIKAFALGLSSSFNTNMVIKGNKFLETIGDGITFGPNSGILIEANEFTHNREPERKHVDAIQGNNGTATDRSSAQASNNVIIRGNTIVISDPGVHEIYMGNGEAKAGLGPGTTEYYKNVLVENNVVKGCQRLGIAIGEVVGVTIRNNSVLRNSTCGTSSVQTPWILVDEKSSQVSITGNTVMGQPTAANIGWLKRPTPSAWVIQGNVVK